MDFEFKSLEGLTLVLRDLGDGLSVARVLFPTALGKKTTWEVEMGGQSGL